MFLCHAFFEDPAIMKILIITGGYLLLLLTVHIVPLAGQELSFVASGNNRAGSLLQTLIFLPWMPIGYLWLQTKAKAVIVCAPISGSAIRPHVSGWQQFMWFLFGILSSCGLEGLLYLLPYRSYEPVNCLYNLLGVFGGWFLLLMMLMFQSRVSSD